MDNDKKPIHIVSETAETVTLTRAAFDSLIEELEDAEDGIAVLEHALVIARLEHALVIARGEHKPPLTVSEVHRILYGDSDEEVNKRRNALDKLAAEAKAMGEYK